MNRRPYRHTSVAFAVALALGLPAYAQNMADAPEGDDGLDTLESLAPIEVQSLRLTTEVLTSPAAVDVTEARDIQQGRAKAQLDAALNRTPGVYANNGSNFAQNLRISIRGFGARSAFGVRGVKVLVDGIPETLADGQAQTDTIDLGAVERLEVIRGPFSALYGNATGGVVDITTTTPASGPVDRGELTVGSHGYRRIEAATAHERGDWGYALTASQLDIEGYRAHSEVKKQQLTGKLERRVGTTGTLRLITRVLDAPDTLDPGGVTLEQAQSDRRSARDANLAFDARQSAEQQTIGLVYEDQLAQNQSYQANLFYSHRDFIQFLPFEDAGVVAYERDFFGGGVQTTRFDTLFGHENQIVAGIDAQIQRDARTRYDNIAGDKGALGLDEDQQATSIGVFAQNVFSISSDLELTTGLRYDYLDFDIDDAFVTATDPNDSGSRTYHEVSANAGLSYAWAERQRVYANVANAFESPTFTEFADPAGNGGFNSELDPQKAVQYEIGAKGEIGNRTRYQISAFWIDVRDELVVFNDDGRRDFYQNSGKSRRQGLEAKLEYAVNDELSAMAAYTLADYEYREFVDDGGVDYAGNAIPGLPEERLFAEVAWRDSDVGYATLDMRYAGSFYADNANTAKIDNAWIFNGRVGKTIDAGDDNLTVYFGIDNMFDEVYFDNIRINAFGGRYYEPAPDRTFYTGLAYEL
ncbi:Putative outer membrane receptor for iron transport protein [Salinisphaera shabanensis E1L3A]|uniref:Outer membrane receptor for iron transport protein n=1 Tax=Salinisphaera shabanensis E1L3A TaxID=1033802 RepID=U2E4A9_9GAMM|nr:TonB-dependent receptor [Salinisphaera shabanensis]ERJ18686.1 Putative outer membrane receptor for iron transport protein [Salinisphaera shabanensis E1L3A]